MTATQLRELIVENPMLIEVTRFRRRYFKFSSGHSINAVVLSLVLLCYAGMVLIVIENRESMSPISIVIFETGLLTLFAPMMLYGAIAGERERRSWDLLLAAPITKAQIVVGKFMGALAALGIAVLMFQVPILIAAFGNQGQERFAYSAPSMGSMDNLDSIPQHENLYWWALLSATLVSLSYLICVCALTLLFSARVKRGLMALGAVLGILMVCLIVIPALTTVQGAGADPISTQVTSLFHPFQTLTLLNQMSNGYYRDSEHALIPRQLWGWPQTFLYLAMAITLLVWAAKTLNFAENEVKFLPQGDKNA